MKDFSGYRQVDVTSNTVLYVPDADPDILIVVPREGTLDTGEDARQNVQHFHAYARSLGRPCGAVVMMANMLAQDADARSAYQGIDPQLFYAGALVVEDPLSRALGSFFLGLSRPKAPAPRRLSAFVLVLSWSRALHAVFTLDESLESFLRGHVAAFQALQGVPRVLLYDNLRSAVLERQGDAVRFHPRLLELCGHYHCVPRPCAVGAAWEKGRVERAMRYLRDAFFAARSFRDVEDLNRQFGAWRDTVAHARRVPGDPTRTVAEALAEELSRLLPLPQHPFPTALVRAVRSGKTPYIRFDRNWYSIPYTLVQRPLTLIADAETVRSATRPRRSPSTSAATTPIVPSKPGNTPFHKIGQRIWFFQPGLNRNNGLRYENGYFSGYPFFICLS